MRYFSHFLRQLTVYRQLYVGPETLWKAATHLRVCRCYFG